MKNIIFDWSGVVKDATVSQLWIVNRIFDKFGVQNITLEEFKENWEQPYMLFYDKYLLDTPREAEQAAYREAIFHADCPKSGAFPGMVELIRNLKSKGHFVAIASSDFPETVLAEIKEYGLENLFDEIITDVNDKHQSVMDLIKRENLERESTFFVGDSNHEIEVAGKVGIKSIAVTWGFCNEKKLRSCNPDFLVKTAKELERIIL